MSDRVHVKTSDINGASSSVRWRLEQVWKMPWPSMNTTLLVGDSLDTEGAFFSIQKGPISLFRSQSTST